MLRFALIGCAGYIAARHIKAIRDIGGELIAATDPHDSVGVLDNYFNNVSYFPEIERFDRHLEKLRRLNPNNSVNYVSICTPNYLHDAHIRLALRLHANAICEKPLVINPWNLDPLKDLEQEYNKKIYTVLQLRLHENIQKLKKQLDNSTTYKKHEIILTYVTRRGPWYYMSWKGDELKSGGIIMNIGIHFFDMLTWIFGYPITSELYLYEKNKASGTLELEKAIVRWFLSIDEKDLPQTTKEQNLPAARSILLNNEYIDFTSGFTNLHTLLYEEIINGKGFGIEDTRQSIELVHKIRTSKTIYPSHDHIHPLLKKYL